MRWSRSACSPSACSATLRSSGRELDDVKTIHQYEVVRRLGTGGNGVVYQATDTRLMRPVVLKLQRARSGDDASELVLREARLAAAIDHPNVCAIYEVGEWDGEPFIAMQFVPGRTLAALIAAGPPSLQLAL